MRNIGDKVTLQNKEYQIVGFQQRSYVVTDASGKKYKVTEAMIDRIVNKTPVKATKPRTKTIYNFNIPNTESELINRLKKIEGSLSPENLHCDGEISRTKAKQKERVLNAEKKVLEQALGRSLTTAELYGRNF
jgi:hypothetical protein